MHHEPEIINKKYQFKSKLANNHEKKITQFFSSSFISFNKKKTKEKSRNCVTSLRERHNLSRRKTQFSKENHTQTHKHRIMATYAAFKHVELYNVGKAKKR